MMSASSQPLHPEDAEGASEEGKVVPPVSPPPAPAPKHLATPVVPPVSPHPTAPPPYGYSPPAYPGFPYGRDLPESRLPKNPIIVGNLSLFVILVSLFFLSAFTFLSGFLLGLWMGGGKKTSGEVSAYSNPHLTTPSATVPPSPAPSPSPYPPQPSLLSQVAGEAAGGVVSNLDIPYVPNALAPAVDDLQNLAAYKAQNVAIKTTTDLEAHQSAVPAPKGTAYTIQLGVFATKENADDLKHKLQEANYRVYVKQERSPDHVAYHVYSGHYATYSEASLAAKQFTTYPGAIVVKLSEGEQKGHE